MSSGGSHLGYSYRHKTKIKAPCNDHLCPMYSMGFISTASSENQRMLFYMYFLYHMSVLYVVNFVISCVGVRGVYFTICVL